MFVTSYSASLTFENIVSLKENLGRFANNVRKQVRADPLVSEILYSPVRVGEWDTRNQVGYKGVFRTSTENDFRHRNMRNRLYTFLCHARISFFSFSLFQ